MVRIPLLERAPQALRPPLPQALSPQLPQALRPRLPQALRPRLPQPRHWPVLLPSVGSRLQLRIDRDPLAFTLQSVSVVPTLLGRLRSVQMTVTDVVWSSV